MMPRYINVDNIEWQTRPLSVQSQPFVTMEAINNMPFITVSPTIHASWNIVDYEQSNSDYYTRTYECSHCSKVSKYISNFCPNCGANMRGGSNDS